MLLSWSYRSLPRAIIVNGVALAAQSSLTRAAQGSPTLGRSDNPFLGGAPSEAPLHEYIVERKTTQPVAAMAWVVLRSVPRSRTVAVVGTSPRHVLFERACAGSLVVVAAAAAAFSVTWNANPPTSSLGGFAFHVTLWWPWLLWLLWLLLWLRCLWLPWLLRWLWLLWLPCL